jgi:hypothetical protein
MYTSATIGCQPERGQKGRAGRDHQAITRPVLQKTELCCSMGTRLLSYSSALLQKHDAGSEFRYPVQQFVLQQICSNLESNLNRISSSLCGKSGGGWR